MEQSKEQQYISALKQAAEKIKELSSQPGDSSPEYIAVVGIGCRYPGGAEGVEGFWRVLEDGVAAAKPMPAERFAADVPESVVKRWIEDYKMWGCFLDDIEYFDPVFFNITPNEALSIDPQHRLLLETSWQAFENGGFIPQNLKGSRTGVFIGISGIDYVRAQLLSDDYNPINAYSLNGISHSVAAGRLSYFYDFHGPSIASDTACSSGLLALYQALHALNSKEINLAVVGGVNCITIPEPYISLTKLGAISPTGQCRAFDDSANGFVRGEGCGVLILKRLSDAQRESSRIWAVIRGMAVNNDGRSAGLTAPNGLAQEKVIREAMKAAAVEPDDIDYIEAHGTGTYLGDPVEVGALSRVFRRRTKDQPLYIGSVKTNIGHQESGAGIAGLIKVILALNHKRIPASLNFNLPNKHIPWNDIPIRVAGQARAWPDSSRKRVAAVSSFGFSGTNAHIILQEPPPEAVRIPPPANPAAALSASALNMPQSSEMADRPRHILTLSVKEQESLPKQIEEHLKTLTAAGTGLIERTETASAYGQGNTASFPIGDYCFSVNTQRSHFPIRKAVQGANEVELAAKLKEALQTLKPPLSAARAAKPKLAFLFTGQGSQYKYMGRGLFETSPRFRESLLKCDELFALHLEENLTDLLFADRIEAKELDQTQWTQPVIFSVGYALAQLLGDWGIKPDLMIGHSIGELTAACLAGVFDLKTAVEIVASRAKLMQSLPLNGGMVAVSAGVEQVKSYLDPLSSTALVSIAAVNAPQSVTISGANDALEAVINQLQQDDIKHQRLHTSHAFHSPLMQPIVKDFRKVLQTKSFQEPQIPVIANVSGQVAAGSELTTADYWVEHILRPVLFADSVKTAAAQNVNWFIEIGGHSTLNSLGRRCVEPGRCQFLPTLLRNQDNWTTLLDTLTALYQGGVDIDWKAFDQPYPRRRRDVPNYAFNKEYIWIKPVTGKAGRQIPSAESTTAAASPQSLAESAQSDSAAALPQPLPLQPSSPSTAKTSDGVARVLVGQLQLMQRQMAMLAEVKSHPTNRKLQDSMTHLQVQLSSPKS